MPSRSDSTFDLSELASQLSNKNSANRSSGQRSSSRGRFAGKQPEHPRGRSTSTQRLPSEHRAASTHRSISRSRSKSRNGSTSQSRSRSENRLKSRNGSASKHRSTSRNSSASKQRSKSRDVSASRRKSSGHRSPEQHVSTQSSGQHDSEYISSTGRLTSDPSNYSIGARHSSSSGQASGSGHQHSGYHGSGEASGSGHPTGDQDPMPRLRMEDRNRRVIRIRTKFHDNARGNVLMVAGSKVSQFLELSGNRCVEVIISNHPTEGGVVFISRNTPPAQGPDADHVREHLTADFTVSRALSICTGLTPFVFSIGSRGRRYWHVMLMGQLEWAGIAENGSTLALHEFLSKKFYPADVRGAVMKMGMFQNADTQRRANEIWRGLQDRVDWLIHINSISLRVQNQIVQSSQPPYRQEAEQMLDQNVADKVRLRAQKERLHLADIEGDRFRNRTSAN